MTHQAPVSPDKALGKFTIPPCPAILHSILSEARSEEPDLNKIISLVSSDAALVAAVLKLVNSLAFRRGNRITSISQAISILGLKNTLLAMYTLYLRKSIAAVPPATTTFLEEFWARFGRVADTAMKFAGMLPKISVDDAYILGLFHDSGILVLMQHFPNYDFNVVLNGSDWERIHENEETLIGMNHAIVGHLFARTWELPTYICEAILHHHDLEPLKSKLGSFPAKEADLIAVLILSVHLAGIHLGLEDKALLAASTTQTLALQHLGIGHEKFMTMADEVLEFLQQAKE